MRIQSFQLQPVLCSRLLVLGPEDVYGSEEDKNPGPVKLIF